ncbi:transporter substrate-binding domain-containing protein [Mesorhizobium sp.]|uniref:transporter substrate-binding domain-containing protein n=1 Tax=Mesorhizobium sp. TaxID=1871066 RepID=UPI00121BAA9D|nr:transporter substrate-binding domain-containing protein [Mesorhizobium sp.]TIL34601.1 MAG: transporter substrate-binding domain-containing protein [Mesorhizobium sp.]TIM48601.1 MAG: transporter substrate-binding domain-containing protein [Mesorhizobium sp.]
MKTTWRKIGGCLSLAVLCATTSQARAGELSDRIASGKSIRIGYANEAPFAFPGENNQPAGFVNAYVLGVLHEMGYDNIESVVTDWGGLIPGLQSDRLDIVTGGLYILRSRCDNVKFAEPVAKVSDAFIVQPGNPKGISTYKDIARKGETLVTGVGYSTIENAKQEGVPEAQIMQVPGPTEILAAVVAGRATAGGSAYVILQDITKKSGGKVEVTDPDKLPEWTQNWVGVAFRGGDKDFVEKFNAAQKKYLGTPQMMKAVAPYGYDQKLLPGDKTTDWVCTNR